MNNVIEFPTPEVEQWNDLESAIQKVLQQRGVNPAAARVVIHNTRPLHDLLHRRIPLPPEINSELRAQIDSSIRSYCTDVFIERLNREIDAL